MKFFHDISNLQELLEQCAAFCVTFGEFCGEFLVKFNIKACFLYFALLQQYELMFSYPDETFLFTQRTLNDCGHCEFDSGLVLYTRSLVSL